jgi:hypothetical protein
MLDYADEIVDVGDAVACAVVLQTIDDFDCGCGVNEVCGANLDSCSTRHDEL